MRSDDRRATVEARHAGRVACRGDRSAAQASDRFNAAFFADEGKGFREALISRILCLPDTYQFVMSMYYEHRMNLKEIASVLHVTDTRVCQIKRRAIDRLRNEMLTWAEQ